MQAPERNMEPLKTRILIVEDNSADEELLMRQIKKAGLDSQVHVIDNGLKALDYLASESRDLIAMFLDLHLPGIGGLELLAQARSFEHLRTLPVIVMTSSHDPADLALCRNFGVTSYVKKPVTFASFSKAIADTFHVPRLSLDNSHSQD